jgi:predicted ribosome quality control (RQC) complex YloA/Tae2 family protein
MNYIFDKIYIDENDKEYIILIGKNAQGNNDILNISHQDDIWFHFKNVSGPHIILCNKGDVIPKRYLHQVANMLYKYKNNIIQNSPVIYTPVKYVKKTSTLGQVILKKYNTI